MIRIEKLTKQHKNFGFKLFFSYIIFAIFLVITITIIHLYFSKDLRKNNFLKEVTLQSVEKKAKFNNYFNIKKDAILAIAQNKYFNQYIKNRSYSDYIELLFFTLMQANKDYMQIRYINEYGQEILRFDRNKYSLNPYKNISLQNKANRYYFKDVSKMKKGDIWFSNIHLNIEHKEIEVPFKPVVRIATPMFSNKEFKGILIINIFMEELIKTLTNSALFDIYLVNYDGYFIKHKNTKHNWSFYNSKRKIDDDFDLNFNKKLKENTKNFIYKNNFTQALFLDKQKISMIMIEKEESLSKMQSNNNKMIVTILFFAMIMSLIFTHLFTKALQGLFELVILQANELHDLATNLDSKVTLKTLEVAKKDRILQNQSKLAELGDMIGNIAHQWRHPLTRLSLSLQNLKAYKNKGKMTDEIFNKTMQNSLEQIEFMSNTIDNFKNFYKKDDKKSEFIIKDAIESVLNIIGAILEHNNISLFINSNKNLSIYANKNEFSQVLMNLIINAKDAIVENKTQKGKIHINILEKNSKMLIEICDNGGGVPSCLQEKIFDPYFTTKEEKGTGIGLYLSKAIVESKLKGKLSIKNSGSGAIFTIEIDKI